MGLFDRLYSAASAEVPAKKSIAGLRVEMFSFAALPESLEEMRALPEADLVDPFKTAALTVCALCAYAADRGVGTEMLNWLKEPYPLTGQDIALLDNGLRDGREYVPFSYFAGAVPENGYIPGRPFTVSVCSDHNSGAEQGYMRLLVLSGGSDTPRPVKLRMRGDGRWFLWEQRLLPDIIADVCK